MQLLGQTTFSRTIGSVAHWSYFFDDLQRSEYTTVLLYEDKLLKSSSWFGDRSVLFRHCKGVNIPDIYEHKNARNHIGETRTSVGSAIMVAHIMGCSKIALVGVDCCRFLGMRYFWQMPGYKRPFRNDGVFFDHYQRCQMKGQVSDTDLLDISRTWNVLGSAINRKCDVYNLSEISILRVFPKMLLEKFLDEYA